MRLHPLALYIAVGGLASHPVVDAFVLPKFKRASETARYHPTTRAGAGTISIQMAEKNIGSQYVSLEESLFDNEKKGFNNNDSSSNDNISNNASDSTKNPTTPQKKTIKPNPRTDKLRAKLEADLAGAEESRTRTAKQLSDAESSRLAFETEAAKAAKEAEALGEKLKVFEAKEAARAVAGGIGGGGGGGLGAVGIAGEIVGPLVGGFAAFGGLAAARDSLAARSQKVEEERLQREEEERKAEQAAKRKVEQEAQTNKILPIVGAGVAGLGAFGAFFSSQGGGNSIVDAISKNTLRDAVPKQAKISQQKNAGSVTTAVPDPSANVNLPYLDKEINKAETKQQQKGRPRKSKSNRQLERDVSEEQRATEARLEQKLADAPELARKAAEAEAEAKAAEETRIEAERQAFLEKEAAERQAAEEKAATEKKSLEAAAATAEKAKVEKFAAEKKTAEEAAAAAEKAKAEKIEKKTAEEAAAAAEKAKAEKIAADKLAFERMKAEEEKVKAEKIVAEQQRAAEKAKAEKSAAEQQRAAEKAKAEKIAADKLAFEKLKAEQKAEAEQKVEAEQKARAEEAAASLQLAEEAAASLQLLQQQDGQFNSFFPKVSAVSEMLFGNNRPSMIAEKGLSNVFGANKIVVGGVALAGLAIAAAVVAANESPSVSSTFKVTGKSPKEYLESEDTDANVASAPKKTIRIPRPEKLESEASNDDPQNSPSAPQTAPLPGSKEALREELVRQRDSINRQAAEKSARDSTADNTPSSLPPTTEATSTDTSKTENMGGSGPAFISSPAKNSFSPFRGVKPKSVIDDALYSPPTSEASMISVARKTPVDQPISPSPEITAAEQRTSDGVLSSKITKKSFSPFGGGKPKAVVNNPLYSPPASSSSTTDNSRDKNPVQSIEQTSDQNIIGGAQSATMPKSSYSPFGGGKPKAVSDDSLYSPPPSRFSSDMGGEVPSASTMERDFSSSEESNPEATIGASLESAQLSQCEPESASTEVSSFTPNSTTRAPKNYSPFSGRKPTAVTDDSLYRPPSSEDPPDSEGYSLRKTEPTIASTDSTLIDLEVSPLPPKNFSPFGGDKSVAASNDSLYSAPTDEPYDTNMNGEESMPFPGSGLNDTPSGAEPETPTFRGTSLKKSFSPFGSKPKGPSGTSGNAYLDNL